MVCQRYFKDVASSARFSETGFLGPTSHEQRTTSSRNGSLLAGAPPGAANPPQRWSMQGT